MSSYSLKKPFRRYLEVRKHKNYGKVVVCVYVCVCVCLSVVSGVRPCAQFQDVVCVMRHFGSHTCLTRDHERKSGYGRDDEDVAGNTNGEGIAACGRALDTHW